MKKKIFAYILLLMPALLMTSCLKDQEDKFSDSATARASKYLANIKETLTSAENGWVLDYFPDRDQSYGGYSYTLKFDDQNVTACFELTEDERESITSTYSLDNEDGPVLAFDTYNDFLHFFATPHPSSGAGGYQAFDGDFIFIVMNISEDKNTITLKGNRTGNIMYMHRIDESIEDYQTELRSFTGDLVFNEAVGEIDGEQYTMYIYSDDRRVEFETPEGEIIDSPFCFDKDGFSLYQPVTIGGKEVRVFKYDEDEGTFTAEEDNSVVFAGLLLPSIVINNVGSNITSGNDANVLEYTFNLADKFTYTSNVDWITVSAEGKTLTINVAENTTGNPRKGEITVEIDGQTATITLTQIEVGDLIGSYTLKAANSQGEDQEVATTISKNDDGTFTMVITYEYNGTWPQTIQMTWNNDASRFEMQSGQPLGIIRSYYSWLVFMNAASGTWTGTSTAITGYLIPTIDDEGNVLLKVGGRYSSYDIDTISFCVSNTEDISGLLGYYEYYTNPVFIKN